MRMPADLEGFQYSGGWSVVRREWQIRGLADQKWCRLRLGRCVRDASYMTIVARP
jgi:hypothetical protein